jgi:hypothetical protein
MVCTLSVYKQTHIDMCHLSEGFFLPSDGPLAKCFYNVYMLPALCFGSTRSASQTEPDFLHSALLLTRLHRALVKSSALDWE